MKRKKKIVFHSNYSRVLTGFGKNSKNILKYLASTGKYEIIELSNGVANGHQALQTLPWKAIGGLPNSQEELDRLTSDPNLSRSAQYGHFQIDQVIKTEKPDIYLGVEDIWGLSPFIQKDWWNKINSMIWTTLDSLPLLPEAVKSASKIKHYYVWSSFAEQSFKKDYGINHVKTLHGGVDDTNFFKFDSVKRSSLRNRFQIDEDSFIIGFVFRNQLRKSVPNLLEGFRIFKKNYPKSKAKLLLHTNFSEGWDIVSLIKEKQIDPRDVLCTYYCPKCSNYDIKPFEGQEKDCSICGSAKSQNTVNISHGVNEKQLNEIYNLMDVYCHPFTSGGQEIPIQEAKLTELITLVTNYSCGIDSCNKDSGGLPLDWSEYREPGTQFIKASTSPQSIFKNLKKVFRMDFNERKIMGKKSRQYVIDNYSIPVIGKKLEEIFDGMDYVEDFSFELEKRDPEYLPNNNQDDSSWLIDIYKNILKIDLDHYDDGHKHWMNQIKNGMSRSNILNYFQSVAHSENSKIEKKDARIDIEDIFAKNENKKALFVSTNSIEDLLLTSSLIKDFKNKFNDVDVYFSTKLTHHSILSGHPCIHQMIPYQKEFSSEKTMLQYFDYYYNFDLVQTPSSSIENKLIDLSSQ